MKTLMLYGLAAALLSPPWSSLKAQVISEIVPSPSRAKATVDVSSVKAGETLVITISLDVAPTEQLATNGYFRGPTDGFPFAANFRPGQQTTTSNVQIPLDADGGEYKLTSVVDANAKHPVPIPIQEITLKVTPQPKKVTILPSKAVAVVVYDQKQYIRSQAAPLTSLVDGLTSRLSKDAADTTALREELIKTLQAADDLLPSVRAKYTSLYIKPPLLKPVLFEDFHRHYLAALIELRAQAAADAQKQKFEQKQPVSQSGELSLGQKGRRVIATESLTQAVAPHLRRVQLARREQTNSDDVHSLKGTYPIAAEHTLELIDKNIAAYLLIGRTGVDTFKIRLASLPSNAQISYKRAGEDYEYLSKRTDVEETVFPLAMWTFRFELEGCKTVERTPDPYIETKINLEPELACKTR